MICTDALANCVTYLREMNSSVEDTLSQFESNSNQFSSMRLPSSDLKEGNDLIKAFNIFINLLFYLYDMANSK